MHIKALMLKRRNETSCRELSIHAHPLPEESPSRATCGKVLDTILGSCRLLYNLILPSLQSSLQLLPGYGRLVTMERGKIVGTII